jgi:carbamoyltransferase
MNVLGVSGVDNAMSFKRAQWPDLEEREIRIVQGQDSAAALVVDGVCVAAAAEERFSRKKHTGDFPSGAIAYCLAEAGLKIEDVDEIAHGFDYSGYSWAYSKDPASAALYREVFSREALEAAVHHALPGLPAQRIQPVPHHLAHAASAYFTSGWDECLTVVIDGMGEADSASVYRAAGGQLTQLARVPAHDSIGALYSVATLHLGFDFNSDEYKIMGLAPYGDPARFRAFFEEAVEFDGDGGFRIPILRLNHDRRDRETYGATRRYLAGRLAPPRDPGAEILDVHCDIAAALQERLDQVILHLCGHWGGRTGLRRLAMAGGVALNCTANGKLMQAGLFDQIYVQPAAADDGSALGAALYRAGVHGEVKNARMLTPFLGPAHPQAAIDAAIQEFSGQIEAVRLPTLEDACREAAALIAAGRVIAWFRGRMEYGPRALGHRSILADPADPAMRDRVNAMVKMREAFRPFAPAVSLEQAHEWFEVAPGTELPYMIVVVDVREAFRAGLPAITHVNGSARVQTVDAHDNPEFHALLRAVGRATGKEMVLNTSFNVKGQPIVNTPREAVETFLRTGIDVLFLENTMLRRRGD